MKTRIALIVLALVVIWLVFDRTRGKDQSEVATPAPVQELRTLDPMDVVAYREMAAPTIRVRTLRDVLPGGFSAAMAPVMIDWEDTDLSPGGWVVIRNVNSGGNPISGVTVLRTIRLRTDHVKTAEFTLVPLGGPKAVSHGQLRFVFEPGGVEFIGGAGEAVGEADVPTDLVISWEAWRPPGADYSVLEGMDHTSYELSARAYTGVQRFLEDALGKRGWESYTLQVPGGQDGLSQLLRVSLALGDGAARYSIGKMMEHAEEQWAAAGPGADSQAGNAVEQWKMVWASSAQKPGGVATDGRLDMAGKTGYQTMLRSCATMALYCIDVTVARQIEDGVPSGGMRPVEKPEILEEPEWMAELATTNLAGLFVRAPKAVQFALANPNTVPSKMPGALNDAGLLVQEDGKPMVRKYSMDGTTPWGRPETLLIK